ncbi:MAG: hypothetical protein RL499_848 [Actinomycetota bacterium]
MNGKNWIAVGAASALGLGVMAGGAASVANAMPLIENATGLSVPGIGTVNDDVERIELDFRVDSDSISSPASTSSPATPSPASPVSADSPVTPQTPASPLSPASVDTPPTPASPASVDTPDDNSGDDNSGDDNSGDDNVNG